MRKLVAVAWLLVTGCVDNVSDGCTADNACKGARICVEGRCADPPSSGSSSSVIRDSSSRGETPPSSSAAETASSIDMQSSSTASSEAPSSSGSAPSSSVETSSSSSSSAPPSSMMAMGRCAPRADVVTDHDVHNEPPLPARPPAGGTIVDPVFGSTIMRVTDESDCSSCSTNYSYWPTFNSDNTRLMFSASGGDGRVLDFDPVAFQRVGTSRALFPSPAPGGGTPFQEDAIWSGLDPDVVFAHEGPRLWAYNVVTQSYALLRDFSEEVPGQYLWQMSRTPDDNVFAAACRDSSTYAYTGFIAWQRDTNTVLIHQNAASLDEVQVDKSGRYLVIKTGMQGRGAIEVRIADLTLGTIVGDLVDDGPDYAPGHSDNGMGSVIGADNWLNRITYRQLATPHTVVPLLESGNDWTQANHLSALADDEDWFLISQYGPPDGLFHQEIFQVSTDGNQRVRRHAHHRSVIHGYEDMPRANISRDGCFAAFTSNWGDSGRRDVFIVKLSE